MRCWLGRIRTLGQSIGAYMVLFFMLSLGVPFLGLLFGHRLLFRRKVDGKYMHKFIGTAMRVVWWTHNNVLSWLLGRGC